MPKTPYDRIKEQYAQFADAVRVYDITVQNYIFKRGDATEADALAILLMHKRVQALMDKAPTLITQFELTQAAHVLENAPIRPLALVAGDAI